MLLWSSFRDLSIDLNGVWSSHMCPVKTVDGTSICPGRSICSANCAVFIDVPLVSSIKCINGKPNRPNILYDVLWGVTEQHMLMKSNRPANFNHGNLVANLRVLTHGSDYSIKCCSTRWRTPPIELLSTSTSTDNQRFSRIRASPCFNAWPYVVNVLICKGDGLQYINSNNKTQHYKFFFVLVCLQRILGMHTLPSNRALSLGDKKQLLWASI